MTGLGAWFVVDGVGWGLDRDPNIIEPPKKYLIASEPNWYVNFSSGGGGFCPGIRVFFANPVHKGTNQELTYVEE